MLLNTDLKAQSSESKLALDFFRVNEFPSITAMICYLEVERFHRCKSVYQMNCHLFLYHFSVSLLKSDDFQKNSW